MDVAEAPRNEFTTVARRRTTKGVAAYLEKNVVRSLLQNERRPKNPQKVEGRIVSEGTSVVVEVRELEATHANFS